MAWRTINQRIGLEGGEEILKELHRIGAEGEAAFKKLRQAAQGSEPISAWREAGEKLRAHLGELGKAASEVGTAFSSLGTAVLESIRNVAAIGGAVIAAAAGFALLVKSAGDVADQLQDSADQIGTTTKELENLTFAAEQANISEEKFSKGMLKLNRSMSESADHAKQESAKVKNAQVGLQRQLQDLNRKFLESDINTVDGLANNAKARESILRNHKRQLADVRREAKLNEDVFQKLGIQVKNADGTFRNTKDVLFDLADAFQRMPNGAEKSAASIKLFSREGAKFIPFLNQGREAIEAMMEQAQRVAPAFTEIEKSAGIKVGDAFDQLARASANLKNKFLLTFAPTVARVFDALTERIVLTRDGILEFAQTMNDKVQPIVQDFIDLMQGNDHRVAKDSIVRQLRDGIVEFSLAVKNAVTGIIIPALLALLAVLNEVAKAINFIFGTQLTGGQIAAALVITKLIGLFGVLRAAINLAEASVNLLFIAFRPLLLAVAVAVAPFAAIAAAGVAIGFALGALVNLLTGRRLDFGLLAERAKFAFNAIVQGVQISWRLILAFWVNGITGVISEVNRLAPNVQQALQAVLTSFANFPLFLAQKFSEGIDAITLFFQTKFNEAIEGVKTLFLGLVEFFKSTVIGQLVTAVVEFVAFLPQKFSEAVTALQTLWQGFKDFFTIKWAEGVQFLQDKTQEFLTWFGGTFVGQILAGIAAIVAKIKEWATAQASVKSSGASGAGSSAPAAQQLAGGGYVRGPGTSTSDSILARLSNGEFVIPADIVRRLGVSFFEAIKATGGRLPDLSKLSLGSMDSLLPARGFATGGMVTATAGAPVGGRPFTLQLGDQAFRLGSAPNDAIDQLQRFASRSRTKSAGRKPTWFQG